MSNFSIQKKEPTAEEKKLKVEIYEHKAKTQF